MATKSSIYKYIWWIPSKEIGDDKPTSFHLRQMSKKDRDIERERTQSNTVTSMILNRINESDVSEDIKNSIVKSKNDLGFNGTLYRNCIDEIRNIFVVNRETGLSEFKEKISNPDEIVSAIAGIEDDEVSNELDSVLWRLSELEEFEEVNFTRTVGLPTVFRMKIEAQKKE